MNLNKQELIEFIDAETSVNYTKRESVKNKRNNKNKHGKDKRGRREKRRQKRGF